MPEYLNKKDAATRFGIARTRLDRLIAKSIIRTYELPGNIHEVLVDADELRAALTPRPMGFSALMDHAFREGMQAGHEDQLTGESKKAIEIKQIAESSASIQVGDDALPFVVSAYIGTYMQGYTRGLHETNFE